MLAGLCSQQGAAETAAQIDGKVDKDNFYTFFFEQQGLMGGLGLKGSKITKITPDE